MNTAHFISTLVVTIHTTIFSGLALANDIDGDGKTYSGLGCTEIPKTDILPKIQEPYGENDIRYNAAGWAYNINENKTIVVACPIVRDSTGKFMKRMWISVLNQTEKNMNCKIESLSETGKFVEESSILTFQSSPNVQTGLLSNDKHDNDAWPDPSFAWVPKLANKYGYYLLKCFLPAAEQLVDEDGPGSGVSFRRAYIARYLIDEAS